MALTQITSEGIKDDEVKTADILNANVTSAKLADGSVTGPKLATESVSTVKIEDGAVTANKLAADVISADKIADNAVVTAAINADAVTAAKIADDAVGSEHIEVLDAALQFGDSVKAQFGTGNDLELWHDGTDTTIKNSTGELHVRGDTLVLASASTYEKYLKGVKDGAVELYHNNVKTFETHGKGITVQGPEGDDADILLNADEGDDNADKWRVRADSVASGFYIQNYESGSWEQSIQCMGGGEVKLYYNNSKEFQTVANGIELTSDTSASGTEQTIYLSPTTTTDRSRSCSISGLNTDGNNNQALVFKTSAAATPAERLRITHGGEVRVPDNGKFTAGASDDLKIYHDGNDSYISDTGTGDLYLSSNKLKVNNGANDETMAIFNENGAVELFYDGTRTCYTGTNSLKFDDNKKAIFGGNLELYHDGTNSYIKEPNSVAGQLIIDGYNGTDIRQGSTGENLIRAIGGGAVKLYHNNTEQLETTNSGVLSPGYYITQQDGDKLLTDASQGGGSNTCYIGNAAIQVSSDQRIKKDIVNTTLDATTKLKQIRVVDFKWDDPSDKAPVNRNSRGIWTGCLAQEMVNIFPHVVNAPRKEDNSVDTESERRWGLEYQHLVPALIKGFQEQQAEIETLKTEKTKLQTDLTALTARVAALEAG